ncbi:MAG: hypothetical protein JSS32_09310 [Verrucomicrobia bacterium]|nr:hypothetical protein [Verrucomicrobiota bacterium]
MCRPVRYAPLNESPQEEPQRVGCFQRFSSLAGRTIQYIKGLGPPSLSGGCLNLGANGLFDQVTGIIGSFTTNWTDLGIGLAASVVGYAECKIAHKVLRGPRFDRLVERPNEMAGAIIGGAGGYIGSYYITKTVLAGLSSLPRGATIPIGLVIRNATGFTLGVVGTAVAIILIDGTIAGVKKIVAACRTVPPAEEALVGGQEAEMVPIGPPSEQPA